MKKKYRFIFIIVMVLITACEKEPYIHLGFDSPIEKNSEGLVIADISGKVEKIYLNGVITLSEGAVEVTLLNSDGNAVYSDTISMQGEFFVHESFTANPGYWKLKYRSREGQGNIDLHLQKH